MDDADTIAPAAQADPPAGPPAESQRPWGRIGLLAALGLVVLAAVAWVVAYYAAGDRVPRGTSVSGVDVGGMRPDEAEEALRAGLANRVEIPFALTAGERTISLAPQRVGFAVDYRASVAAAGGERSWSPGRLWDYWTGGSDLEAVVTVDEQAMAGRLDSLATRVATRPVDGTIRFRQGEVRVREPVVGERLDTEAAGALLREAYLGADLSLDLPMAPDAPAVGADDVAQARADFADPAMSGPVTLRFESERVELRPREYAAALSMKAEAGELIPVLNARRVERLVAGRVSKQDESVDADVRLVDGRPQVIPARPGVGYDPRDISGEFLALVARPAEDRVLAVPATVVPADFTTAEARDLGIKREVSTFTTYFPYAEYRNINIGRAAELVNGTVLRPGETFSLNDVVGERTPENGFVEGFVIENGLFQESLGGGVSQMATTTFNAAFFAGLEDVEHKPHSFYISRYPEGREATVAWGSVDLKFENDTPHGVLIEAVLSPSAPGGEGSVTVTMWSTKTWDITTSTSGRSNFTSPGTQTLTTDDCVPNEGYGGFDVSVWRYFRRPGSDDLVRTERFDTTYIPADTVICRDPNDPLPGPND